MAFNEVRINGQLAAISGDLMCGNVFSGLLMEQ